jgi:hypothetical protein
VSAFADDHYLAREIRGRLDPDGIVRRHEGEVRVVLPSNTRSLSRRYSAKEACQSM